MKFNKLFLIGLAPIFLLSACGTNQETKPSSDNEPGSSEPSSPGDGSNKSILSNAFKEMGEEIAYVAASKPRTRSMVDMPEIDKKIQLATPSGLVYVAGKLYENEGFDCSNKVVEFSEVYDMESGPDTPTMVADITLSLMIDVDIANNKAKIYIDEIIDATQESMHMYTDAYMFLEFDYNFTTNKLGDFKAWNKADVYLNGSETPNTGINYAVRQGEELKKIDTATQDAEYNTVVNQIETFIALFDSKAETKTVADATTARKYGESFIAGQNYINEIINGYGSIDFHNK
ncbi:MAG: hypothetical protein IJQ72_02180 [Bacilli bacterium]|nr:hypothetical protein [Bacilli bacterium]